MKKCTKCQMEKELSEFYKNKNNKDGFQHNCKLCAKEYKKDNQDRIKELSKEWRQNNEEKVKEKNKEYRDNNKEKIKEYRKINKEKIATNQVEYYKDNEEKIKEKCREYRKNNKDKINKYMRDRYNGNPKHKLKMNIRRSNSRNINRSLIKTKSPSSKLMQLFDIQNYECIYCKVDISESRHVDHLIPLSKNGSNLITNLVLACPDCNLRKSDKNLYQFLEEEKIDYNTFVLSLGERNDKYFRDENELA